MLQVIAMALIIVRLAARFNSIQSTFSKEIHTMDATTKSVLAIAFAIAAFLLLLFGGANTTGLMI